MDLDEIVRTISGLKGWTTNFLMVLYDTPMTASVLAQHVNDRLRHLDPNINLVARDVHAALKQAIQLRLAELVPPVGRGEFAYRLTEEGSKGIVAWAKTQPHIANSAAA